MALNIACAAGVDWMHMYVAENVWRIANAEIRGQVRDACASLEFI